ncbi:MAG: antitoxin MazE family protein [Geminicoccales bacterium]
MAGHSKSTSSRAKVAAHRARLRARGLRPVQIWVPDVRSPEFKAEAERQARLVATDRHEAETMAFIEAAADWGGEE